MKRCDGDEADERRPLLCSNKFDTFDLTDLRERAAKLNPLIDYTYVEHENMPGYVVLRHVVGALAQVTVVLGAYFFLQSTGESIMPRCDLWEKTFLPNHSTERWLEHICYVSAGCFWTFPIICPLAIIVLFWKNLLDKRLFYECLFNRIFLVQQSYSYLVSPIFWFLFVYFLCGISCIFFIRYGTDRPYDEFIFSMLAYISPTVGFVMVLLSHWSVNRLIVSLPLYVERDCPAAMDLLKECKFMSSEDFWRAFSLTEGLLADVMQEQRAQLTLNTAEFMRLVLDVHAAGRTPARRDGFGCFERAWDLFCSLCRAAHERYIRGYWVSRFLFSPLFQDVRARRFRLWARVYYAFMCVSTLVFAYAMLYTINELFHYYHTVPMYMSLPAPRTVPRVIGNATEHVPEVVGQVQDELRGLNRQQVVLAGFVQQVVTGFIGNATKHVPEVVGKVEGELRRLKRQQRVVPGATGNATEHVLEEVGKVQDELRGLTRQQFALAGIAQRVVTGVIGNATEHAAEVVGKVVDELRALNPPQFALAGVAQRVVTGVIRNSTQHVREVVGEVEDELRVLDR